MSTGRVLSSPIIISVLGQKGGVGKSTLARALATVAASAELRVTLVDLDVRQQTSVRWSQARTTTRAAVLVGSTAYESFGEALADADDADMLVVDTPGFLTEDTIEIARKSDIVILPTGSSSDDIHPTTALLYELQYAGLPKDRLCVAICRNLSDEEEASARRYFASAGHPALDGAIPEHITYRSAQNSGRSLTETTDEALNTLAYELIGSVLKKLIVTLAASKVA